MMVHSDEKPFECQLCSYKFKYKRNLKAHMGGHSVDNPLEYRMYSYKSVACKSGYTTALW